MPDYQPRIVVIEDEAQIRQFVQTSLASQGFEVLEADTGEQGLIECTRHKPDLVIADLGLPDIDGVEVIRKLRGWSTAPVIVLSARTQEVHKIAALDAGADDYLTKPFSTGELFARVRAHLRRYTQAPNRPDSEIRFGEVVVDLTAHKVSRAGDEVRLTPIEFRLLAALIRNAGKMVTHRQLLAEVWGPSYVEHAHYLRIYMGHLRQKLEADPAQPKHIVTEVGLGYRFEME